MESNSPYVDCKLKVTLENSSNILYRRQNIAQARNSVKNQQCVTCHELGILSKLEKINKRMPLWFTNKTLESDSDDATQSHVCIAGPLGSFQEVTLPRGFRTTP